MAAHQLDWDKNFVSRLDQKLAEQPLKSDALYEMMNFGINGVGTVEEMLVYDAYVKKYHPGGVNWKLINPLYQYEQKL